MTKEELKRAVDRLYVYPPPSGADRHFTTEEKRYVEAKEFLLDFINLKSEKKTTAFDENANRPGQKQNLFSKDDDPDDILDAFYSNWCSGMTKENLEVFKNDVIILLEKLFNCKKFPKGMWE